MGNEIRKRFQVGERVYRGCRDPRTNKIWYDSFAVRRITPQYVFVEPPDRSRGSDVRLSRAGLERRGYDSNHTHGAYYVELPPEYRKETLEYLWAEGPRAVLGLPPDFTQAMLKDKHREFARKYHPDGDEPDVTKFRAVQESYERLTDGPSLADLIDFIRQKMNEE